MAVKTGRIRRAFTFTRSDLRSYAMLAPYLFFYALTILVPLVITVALSFTTYNMFQMPKWAGLDNFIRIFIADDVFLKAFTNTILFAVFTGPLSFLLCFFVAWVINDLPPKLRALVTLVFYAPSISGTAYVMWSFIFSPDANGIANGWLMGLGILDEPLLWFQDTKMSLGLLIAVQIWLSLGVGFLSFIAGLQNVDRDMYEAGAIDGIRNRWQELWYITLPAMKPMLLFGGITQITSAFSVSDISMTLTGFPSVQYATHTLSLHAYDFGIVRYEMGYASAVSVVLFILILFTYKLFNFLLSRLGS
ncbi:MAG: carbohydrate ABC transporter permease [Acutalibacteraceae bacterium]